MLDWLENQGHWGFIWLSLAVTVTLVLADALPPGHAVAAVHVPRRYVPGREPRPTLYEMAAHYAEVVRAHQPRGPYRLLGLCYGGVVALEAARLLEQAEAEGLGDLDNSAIFQVIERAKA